MSKLRKSVLILAIATALLAMGCSTDDPPVRNDTGSTTDTNKFESQDGGPDLPRADLPGQDLNQNDTVHVDLSAHDLPQNPDQGTPAPDQGTPTPDQGTPAPDLPTNSCTALTASGLHLNPGCDPDVQVNGITAFSAFDATDTAAWLMMSGKKFWIYDPTSGASGAFTSAGESVAEYLTPLNPANCTDTMGGVPLNPGCDVSVQANGLTAVDILTTNGQTSWTFLSGTKFWSFDASAASGAGAFTGSGADWSSSLRALAPADCTTMMGGVHLNPGCDVDIQANGVVSIGSVTDPSNVTWLLTSGKKFWFYSTSANAFTSSGDSFATSLLPLTPNNCTALTPDGLALNPGCDLDVQTNGISASGTLTMGGNTVWLIISGRKFWLYDYSAAGGAGAFTTGGQNIAPTLRQLAPQ